jgi:hypothetical protein
MKLSSSIIIVLLLAVNRLTSDAKVVGPKQHRLNNSKPNIELSSHDKQQPELSSASIRNLATIRTSASLSTEFSSSSSISNYNGNMFQVNAKNCVVIRFMQVNGYGLNSNLTVLTSSFEVYAKSGVYWKVKLRTAQFGTGLMQEEIY